MSRDDDAPTQTDQTTGTEREARTWRAPCTDRIPQRIQRSSGMSYAWTRAEVRMRGLGLLRFLNRREYDATARDLLDLDIARSCTDDHECAVDLQSPSMPTPFESDWARCRRCWSPTPRAETTDASSARSG